MQFKFQGNKVFVLDIGSNETVCSYKRNQCI